MTSTRPTSSWPVAIAWWFGGAFLTVITWLMAMNYVGAIAGAFGDIGVRFLALIVVGGAAIVAERLPRRARAMFVAGFVTPILLGLAFVIWLIWALSQSNFTF